MPTYQGCERNIWGALLGLFQLWGLQGMVLLSQFTNLWTWGEWGWGEDLAFQILWFEIISCLSDAGFSAFTPPKYVTLPPSVSPLYPYNPPLSSVMGLSDSLCPFLQICWHSPFIEVRTRKKGLPYVRQSLCKSFMDLWHKGLSMWPTLSFIHSQPNIPGLLTGTV